MAAENARPHILIFGANGQVGHELSRALASCGPVTALDRTVADLARPEALRAVIRDHRPDVIVNAAAYTAVDRAESEPALAETVNAVAPAVIAEEASRAGATLVHYSTDYVFDGAKLGAYAETDAVHPLSVYGRTKLDGERAIANAEPRHLILRTSWVVSARGTNFIRTMLRLAGERDSLRVVADQHGVPTTAALLARATRALVEAMHGVDARDPRWGVYHLVPSGQTTWHELAMYVIAGARHRGAALRATPESVAAIATSDYPTAAHRPANSRLDTSKVRQAFGLELPEWRAGVDDVLDQLVPR